MFRVYNQFRKAYKKYNKGKLVSSKGLIDFKSIFDKLGKCPGKREDWHIDHIKPLSSFDMTKENDIIRAWSPDNLQWLSAKENLKKGNKILDDCKEGYKKMGITLKEFAKEHEPPQLTKNIADLEAVPVSAEIKERKGQTKLGEDFSYMYIEINGEDYRVPISVIEQLKFLLESKPDQETFKVNKSGEGLNTKYLVLAN